MATIDSREKPAPVYLASVLEPLAQMDGSVRPQRVTAMLQDTAVIQVDSDLRKTGDDFDFIIDFLQSNASFRQIHLKRVLMPIIPQINEANNEISVRLQIGGVRTGVLPNGYYSPDRFANMLNEVMGQMWLAGDPTNEVSVTYEPLTREIKIVDGNGRQFQILSESSYARYGTNVAEFRSAPSTVTETSSELTSLSMGMVFTRYVQVISCELVKNQRGSSIVAGRGALSLIGIIDIISAYDPAQWSPANIYPGTSATYEIRTAPRLNMRDSGTTPRVVDFQLRDEWGFTLGRIGPGIRYPTSLWFEVLL